jgi:hypothetical protein
MIKHIEDNHQVAIFSWAKLINITLPNSEVVKLADVMYAIPNGGKRNKREAGRFKAQGVKAGVSDIHLPIASKGYHGLWVELKKPKVKGDKSPPKVSPAQKSWLEIMEKAGHYCVVSYGADEARAAINDYLGYVLVNK